MASRDVGDLRIFFQSRRVTCLISLLLAAVGVLRFSRAGEDEFITSGGTRNWRASFDVGDPISASAGAYHFSIPLLNLGGALPLDFELIYRSDFDSELGLERVPPRFWWRPFTAAMVGNVLGGTPYATFQLLDGNLVSFKKAGTTWVPVGPTENVGFITYVDNASSLRYVMEERPDYVYLMNPVAERIYIYRQVQESPFGYRIERIVDRNGNQLIYNYVDPQAQNPSRIEDGLGRRLDLTYGLVGGLLFLQRVTDQSGRQVELNYEAVGSDNSNQATLRSVRDTLGQTTTFRYANLIEPYLITRLDLPRGNSPYTQTYALARGTRFISRVISQRDALGNTTTLSYEPTTVTRPDGTSERYEHYSHHGLPKTFTDAADKKAEFTKNDNEQLTALTDRLGGSTSFTYHAASGKPASLTNAKGDAIRFGYTAQNQMFTNPANNEQVTFTFYNLTRMDYPDGANEQWTYDGRGNVLTRVDQAGQTWGVTYNDRGDMITAANPTGGVTTFTYNSDATVATRKDSDRGTTTFSYDALKRPTKITHPDGSFFQIVYDANDRITSTTDENNRTTTYAYDANGNLTQVTNPAGESARFSYDALDRISQTSNRLGKNTNFQYDSLGRLASITDAAGVASSFAYDPRGLPDRTTLGGAVWRERYDEEEEVSSRTTPLGYTTTRQTDAVGFPTGLTNPLNQTTILSRDTMGRILAHTDPLARQTRFTYDGRGKLTGVAVPLVGSVAYQRDALGLIGRITDLNGRNWSFSYTSMGRLTGETDPLGRTWQYGYDTRGRRTRITFPDNTSVNFSYDAAGSLTRKLYSDGADLQFSYDSLKRLTKTNDIQFSYDAQGQITNTETQGTSFGATYDDAGRLKTVSYNNNTFAVTYSYDATSGLLSGVTDSLTNTRTGFAYDNDFRLTATTRSNNVHTTRTWDNAARLTRIQEGNIMDLKYTLDAVGQVTQVDFTAPLDPASRLTSSTENFTYDFASQLVSGGFTYDQRGRMTSSSERAYRWDGASRLVGIGSATLTYNALGQVVTRAESGTTMHYYYNHALRLAPIVAEKNDTTGSFLRYYVWTPGGSLLYMIDAADGNKVYHYHFDRTGSTLALTDTTGKVTDSYAYDPYGRVLAHQGTSAQPFTFVGKWGVRQEGGAGTLYHMRARYFDATTARFLSREWIWPLIHDPRLINPYQYALNDPVRHLDFDGRSLTKEEENELDVLVRAINDYSRKLEDDFFTSAERERRVAEDMVLAALQTRVSMSSKLPGMPADPALLREYQERLEEIKAERERINKVKAEGREEMKNQLERMQQRFKELAFKKAGGKEAFLWKRRLLIKVVKLIKRAGPKTQVFYENVGKILMEQVEPIFFEFEEDLDKLIEGDAEARGIVDSIEWDLRFGR